MKSKKTTSAECSFEDFALRVYPFIELTSFHKTYYRVLEAYAQGRIRKLIVSVPPQHGKSVAAALMGDATFNSNTMWEYWPSVGDITNSSGFSAIPAGYTNLKGSTFDGVYEYAAFWTATEGDNASEAYCAYLICDEPELFIGKRDKESFGASVRCIKK